MKPLKIPNHLSLTDPIAKAVIEPNFLQVDPSTPLLEAIAAMDQMEEQSNATAGCALVIQGSHLVGILTDIDIVRLCARIAPLDQLLVGDVMVQPVTTLLETELRNPLSAVILLHQKQVKHLPIVDQNHKIVGLVTSTTIQKGLQPENLLRLHRVEEVMTTQVAHVSSRSSALKLAQVMTEAKTSCIVLAEDRNDGKIVPVGLVTAHDIVHAQAQGNDLGQLPALTIMRHSPFPLRPSDSVWLAYEEMQQRQALGLVVVDHEGHLLGLVTQSGMLQAFDPTEMHKLVKRLQHSLKRIEVEKVDLLQSRNSELERMVKSRTSQLEEQMKCDRLLAMITLRIHQSLDLQEVLTTTVSQVRQLIQTDRTILYRINSKNQAEVLVESVAPGWISMLGQTLSDFWLPTIRTEDSQTGSMQFFEDLDTANISPGDKEALARLQIQSAIVVPIQQGQKLWGFLSIQQCAKSRQWKNWEVSLLEQLVKQVGIAIQQSELHQQVQAELNERQRLESELTHLFNLSADLVCIVSKTGYFKRLNPAFSRTLGYTEAELLARPFVSFLHPEDQDLTLQEMEKLTQGASTCYFENRLSCRDGSYRWLAWTVVPDNPTQGLLFYAIARDITSQKEVATYQATQLAVTQILAEATDLHVAIPQLLQSLCQELSWELGELWHLEAGQLRVEHVWHRSSPLLAEFTATNQQLALAPGDGLSGRVCLSGQPVWISDLATDHHFLNAVEATAAGLQSAIAFPLITPSSITGVMVFYSHKIQPPNDMLLNMMSAIGQSISQFIERQQAEIALKQVNDELETKVEERTASWRQVADQLLIEIAERNRAEAALTQANDQLQAVLDAVPGSVSWITSDLHYLGVNRHLAAALNRSPESFIGQPIGFLHNSSQFCHFLEDFFAAPIQTTAQEVTVDLEGTFHSYLIVAQKYNQNQAAVSVGIDITARKQVENALQDSEAKFRNLVERTNDWVWEMDHQLRFTYVNPRIQALIGYEPEQVLNHKIFDFMLPDEAVRFSTVLDYFIHQQEAFSQLEAIVMHQSGHSVVLEISGAPVFNAQRKLQGYQGITRDITERKQVERDIRTALTKEKELNELKTRFISMASHEFRTPLTTILASAEALERYHLKWPEDKKKTSLRRVQTAAKHMTQLLNDVLTVGKADAGKLEAKPTHVNLEEYCNDLIEEIQLGEEKSDRIIFTKSGDCQYVLLDEQLIKHILSNLLSNALKYSPKDSLVTLNVVCNNQTVTFQVHDTGIGIPDEDQVRLFDPFHRATNVGNIPGTGLGLTIVKRSVKAHHGIVHVTSNPELGTTFTVRIPL